MNWSVLLPLSWFAFVSSITPGPNNLMLMASGVNFGFRRTIPHMLGIGIGFTVMVLLVGLGLAQIFERYPWTNIALTIFSVIYMLWLAWKIANAAAPQDGEVGGTPMTFVQAALFQWVNPKAWAMALGAITIYAADNSIAAVSFVAIVFGLINLPCVSVWTLLGVAVKELLQDPRYLRAFNWTMAGFLVASLYPILMPH
ncbi:MAG: LysE family translocator [Pseudomonadota bacterium]